MGYDLNRFSGILMLFFCGGSCASFPASFILYGHYQPIAGAVFAIIGASFLMVTAILLFMNRKSGPSDVGREKAVERSQMGTLTK